MNSSCNVRRIIASLSGRVETTKRHDETMKRHYEKTKRRNDKGDQPTNRTGNSPSRLQKSACWNHETTWRNDETTNRHNETTSRTFCPRSTFIGESTRLYQCDLVSNPAKFKLGLCIVVGSRVVPRVSIFKEIICNRIPIQILRFLLCVACRIGKLWYDAGCLTIKMASKTVIRLYSPAHGNTTRLWYSVLFTVYELLTIFII